MVNMKLFSIVFELFGETLALFQKLSVTLKYHTDSKSCAKVLISTCLNESQDKK